MQVQVFAVCQGKVRKMQMQRLQMRRVCLQEVIPKLWLVVLTISLCQNLHAEDLDVLISALGSSSYAEREDSAEKIRKAGHEAVAHLERHFEDCDLEIALKSRELYEEYLHIEDVEMPSIWFLDNEHRFPEGYEITYSPNFSVCSIKFKIDVAERFYCDVKRPKLETVADHCNELYFNLFDTFWRDPKASSKAMRNYVRSELKRGKSKEEIKSILKKAADNANSQELMYQTSDIDSNGWDYWRLPPGVMVFKEEFVFPSR